MCLAVPGRIVSVGDDALKMGKVSFGGMIKDVSLALVPEARVGDYVMVHVGFAISIVDEGAALRSIELFKTLAARSRSDTAPEEREGGMTP